MPDWLPTSDLSFDRIPMGPFDTRLWWLLIALCVALILTIQAIETAIEGAWPNQRRPSQLVPRARMAQGSWGFVAMFVLAGALLLVGSIAVLIWRDPPQPDGLVLGGTLLGIGWLLFLLFSLNIIGLGKLMANLGPVGPFAILIILIVGDILLFVALRDILPSGQEVRDGIENGLKEILPFLD